MRVSDLCLAILLVSAWGVSAQDQPPPQRPTLGKQAPSLHGPRASNTADARKLLRVHRIYVERIDNLLSERLTEGLAKSARFSVVDDRDDADAVLRGTCFSLRRLKSVHSEVYLNTPEGAPIWEDNLRRPYNPPALSKVVDETANLIVEHLMESVREAHRK
jgi:hypothetical protein